MQPGRVRQADDEAFRRDQARNRLAPWLEARLVQKREAASRQLGRGRADSVWIGHLELDTRLRRDPVGWPLRRTEAGFGGLGERPDSEMPAARDLLAVVVVVTFAVGQRQPERLDVQSSA